MHASLWTKAGFERVWRDIAVILVAFSVLWWDWETPKYLSHLKVLPISTTHI